MKKFASLIILFFVPIFAIKAQGFNKSINKDSLFREMIKLLPKEKQVELSETYKSADPQSQEFLLFMLSMPRSSKAEMIKNIDSNYSNIVKLQTGYSQLVPKGFKVYIEFNPINNILKTKESIDLKIYHKKGIENITDQEWDLEFGAAKLNKMLKTIGWNDDTLLKIKNLLKDANSISIENGDVTNIGFARSGMDKYSYNLFNHDLTAIEIKKNNDKCTFIFYKKNIVLEYGGGAMGSQCFPD